MDSPSLSLSISRRSRLCGRLLRVRGPISNDELMIILKVAIELTEERRLRIARLIFRIHQGEPAILGRRERDEVFE